MARPNTIYHLNPALIGPISPPNAEVSGATAFEISYWFWRAKTFSISGSFTNTDGTFPISETLILDASDEVGNYIGGGDTGIRSFTSAHYILSIKQGELFGHTGTADESGWSFPVLFSLEGVNNALQGTPDVGHPNLSAFTVTYNGVDGVTGTTYNHVLPTWEEPSPADAISGGITITPSEYFPFEDDEGVALYDTTTGALIP